MPRHPPKHPVDDDDSRPTSKRDRERIRFVPEKVPPSVVDGRPSRAHYRVRLANLANLNESHMIQFGAPVAGLASSMAAIRTEARLAGLSDVDIGDQRTDMERATGAVLQLLAEPTEAMELKERDLDLAIAAVDRGMDHIEAMCADIIEGRADEAVRTDRPWGSADDARKALDRGKAWRGRLERVKRLQHRAKTPCPKGSNPRQTASIQAAELGRFMLYVGRSNMPGFIKQGPAACVFKLARHHAKMIVDLWEAEHGVRYDPPYYEGDDDDGGVKYDRIPYTGCILVAPPGHGKTEIHAHWAVRRLNRNPYEQGMITHAVEAEAIKLLGYVAACFNPDERSGRRNLALVEHTLAGDNNNTKMMRLELPERTKQATLEACGTRAAKSGANLSFVSLDDPVDQRENEQEAERKRTYERLVGTILKRLRGGNYGDNFNLTTCTLWHLDDANCRRIRLAAAGDEMVRVSIQSCGGPEENFRPLWPEMYPREYLRREYKRMGPALYSAAYQSNPEAEHLRVVRKIRLYDPRTEEHRTFLRTCVRRLSIDPSATAKETSDKAGIVYMGDGLLTGVGQDENGNETEQTEYRIRVFDAYEIFSTQSDAIEWIATYITKCPTHFLHAETVSAFAGFGERIDREFNIPCIRHQPMNADKIQRLKACSSLLEDGLGEHARRAIVEFPGVPDEANPDKLVPDPQIAWLVEEVIRARTCPHKHGLDALTQVLNHLAATEDIGTGDGIDTRVVQRVTQARPRGARPLRFEHVDGLVMSNRETIHSAGEEELIWQLN